MRESVGKDFEFSRASNLVGIFTILLSQTQHLNNVELCLFIFQESEHHDSVQSNTNTIRIFQRNTRGGIATQNAHTVRFRFSTDTFHLFYGFLFLKYNDSFVFNCWGHFTLFWEYQPPVYSTSYNQAQKSRIVTITRKRAFFFHSLSKHYQFL